MDKRKNTDSEASKKSSKKKQKLSQTKEKSMKRVQWTAKDLSSIKLIAVTGASGFIGSYVVKALLDSGFNVRAIVRDPTNNLKTQHLKDLFDSSSKTHKKQALTFGKGDLLVEGSFDEAFQGVDAVIHCAAVVSNASLVSDPMKAIVDPSVQGSKNVYASIIKAGTVKRVIHTSSVASILSYDKPQNHVFTEESWNNWSSAQNGDYYGLAKTKAERLAFAMMDDEKNEFDVVSINPAIVFGPCLTKAHTKASNYLIRNFLYGKVHLDFCSNTVDVRDVAQAHVRALLKVGAAGERYLVCGDKKTHRFDTLGALADKCREVSKSDDAVNKFSLTAKVYSGLLFNIAWYLKLSAFEKKVYTSLWSCDNSKSKKELGVTYTEYSIEQTLKDTIDSMLKTGFVNPKQ